MPDNDDLQFLLAERQHLDDRIRELRAEFEPLPEGDYEAMITDVEKRQTQTTGKTYWRIKFDVLSGPYRGRTVWMNIVENINPQLVQLQRVASVDLSYTITWGPNDPTALVGYEVIIQVGRARYAERDYNEVRAVRAAG